MSDAPLILEGIQRRFRVGDETIAVLRGLNLQVGRGEIVALLGQSGAGKSTLLHVAGLLEAANEGRVVIAGQDASRLNDEARTAIRREKIGFVYQYHHLLPEFSALENVVMPQMIAGKAKSLARDRAQAMLEQVGLGHRLHHRPGKLSGGEQQRTAIARALANDPAILLADEPTGNLDTHNSGMIFDLLLGLVRARGMSALIATHNPDLARRMDRIVTLRDGVIEKA